MPLLTKHFAKKNLSQADEVRTPPKSYIEFFRLGDHVVMRGTLEPGWRWSEVLKSGAGTESCEAEHLGYLMAGRMGIRMNDGTEVEYGAGDLVFIPSGHDAWVIGDEQAVLLDFTGGEIISKASG